MPQISSQNGNKAGADNLPFAHHKIPISYSLQDFVAFINQYSHFNFCPYIANKTAADWDISTSRVYMNQVLPGFLYVPVNITGNDLRGLTNFLKAVGDDNRIAAVNITQPHKSSPVIRHMFFGDENSDKNVDTLIRDKQHNLRPYDLNAPSFVSWYKEEVGKFQGKTIIIVGVGGTGEPLAKAIVKEGPGKLTLIDHHDKTHLAAQLSKYVPVNYQPSIESVENTSIKGELILINAAGKEGVTDNTSLTCMLKSLAIGTNIFVDIRPQLSLEVVSHAKELGWQAYTGYGMNARNDYSLLEGISSYMGTQPCDFSVFRTFVEEAS